VIGCGPIPLRHSVGGSDCNITPVGSLMLSIISTPPAQSFATLDDALHGLGLVRGFPMLDAKLLHAGGRVWASVAAVR